MCFAVYVCVSVLSGGALEKVELRDLLILEQSIFKTLFLKLAKLLGHPATSLPVSLTMTQASELMLQ